jgi:hypothetical protein
VEHAVELPLQLFAIESPQRVAETWCIAFLNFIEAVLQSCHLNLVT